jgi:hypothetical protein
MDRKWNAENRMHILYYIQNPRAQKSEICFTWGPGMQRLYKYRPWSLELLKKSGEKLAGKQKRKWSWAPETLSQSVIPGVLRIKLVFIKLKVNKIKLLVEFMNLFSAYTIICFGNILFLR